MHTAEIVDQIADSEAVDAADVIKFPERLADHDLSPEDITPGVIHRAREIHQAKMNEIRARIDPQKKKGTDVEIVHRQSGWWITGRDCEDLGPFDTLGEAKESRRGLKRFDTHCEELNIMATDTALEVTREEALDLYEAFQFKSAVDWPDARLVKNLGKMVAAYDEEEHDLSKPQKQLLDDITQALEDDCEIIIAAEEEEEEEEEDKPKRRSSKASKKTTKKTAKKTTTPAGSGKKKTAKKASTSSKATKKTAKKKTEKKGPSNKEIVYKAWKKSPKKSTPEVLFNLVDEAVQLQTIKSWLNQWKKGNNLPACAKES